MGCSVTGAAKSAGCDILGVEWVRRNEKVKGRPQEDVKRWGTEQDVDWLLGLEVIGRKKDESFKACSWPYMLIGRVPPTHGTPSGEMQARDWVA